MKTTLFTSLATTIAILSTTTLANHCSNEWHEGALFIARKWLVIGTGIDDIPGRCGGFWDNMNNSNFHGACAVSQPNCGEDGNGDMVINFVVGSGCNGGHVESAWWEATQNEFGPLDCP